MVVPLRPSTGPHRQGNLTAPPETPRIPEAASDLSAATGLQSLAAACQVIQQ